MFMMAPAGTLWYAVAVGVVGLTKIYYANKENKPLPLLLLAVVAASGASASLACCCRSIVHISRHAGRMHGINWLFREVCCCHRMEAIRPL
jgi:hypothetical protein